MSANEKQVGGEHYRSGYQHWDFTDDVKLGYHAAVATKYVSRWRKKNGIEDLKKCLHFVEKLTEVSEKRAALVDGYIARYLTENDITDALERAVITALAAPEVRLTQLHIARASIMGLLIREEHKCRTHRLVTEDEVQEILSQTVPPAHPDLLE